ncbi:hypothetical protein PISMIDRAFT_677989 [Pisolithus microcarpus 441]|uniref:Ricin B lectin domain-containing protein n=1 Tax=Pisolithus microcarpus 441 TaxID=765257 RepID=A0A0C9Y497_9AGAM|nr:hypothetical protein PISMIDRAFT_689964 [Pisolithus microcarpus 441]KIK24613.1 hypothetical protein PISMIDRAFT_677989 [Pisolithus microcarpus 441]
MVADIQSGIYAIINVEAINVCLEILGPQSNFAVIAQPFRSHPNQAWMVHRGVDGTYAISGLHHPLLLNAFPSEHGARVVGMPVTCWWSIENEPGFENIYRLSLAHTYLDLEIANNGGFLLGGPITVGERSGGHNQLWRLQRLSFVVS